MTVNEKIDFLMKVTDTANSVLGKYLSFDASYISRMRSGKRNVPDNSEFMESISDFFAGRIENSYQKKIACEFICPGKEWPDNKTAAKKFIYNWLSHTDGQSKAPVETLLSGFANIKSADILTLSDTGANIPEVKNMQFFYGDSGKRQAVALFLSELIQLDSPPPLLLYSNEEFNWMYEDPAYAKKWALLLFSYIKKGGKIRIAHTISRASGEMLVALQKWIPIYMTGAVEPYFYPKILDRVFRKTMFIAEGHSAIIASSVGDHTNNAINCYINDKAAVKSFETEYKYFLEMCKPLMQIYNFAKKDKFLKALESFNADSENMITVRTAPSFYTMPKSVAESITKRLDSSWVLKRQEKAARSFDDMLEAGHSLTEVLNLPDADTIKLGKVYFPMCDLLDKPGLFYTAEEFQEHLESVIEHLKKYENYNVVLSSAIPSNEIVYVKEDVGVILVKSDFPNIAFAINEQRMVSAFWDYLGELSETSAKKEKVIEQLENLINQL